MLNLQPCTLLAGVAELGLVRRLGYSVVPQESLLMTIAQVAVTLAGFCGLVIAMRTTPTARWHARDTWSLAWMLGTSLGALFLALLPLLLESFGLSKGFLWMLATMIMSGAMLVFASAMALAGRLSREPVIAREYAISRPSPAF
jgi:hypothetical protein